jgi:hypothetical protein
MMGAIGGSWSNMGRRGAEENEAHCRQRKPGVTKQRDARLSCLWSSLLVMLCNPLRDCPLQRRAFVPALHLLKSALRQIRHVRQPALPDTRISDHINRLAEFPPGAVLALGIAGHPRRPGGLSRLRRARLLRPRFRLLSGSGLEFYVKWSSYEPAFWRLCHQRAPRTSRHSKIEFESGNASTASMKSSGGE